MQEVFVDISTMGASLFAISPQDPAHTRATADELKLTYPVLSDLHNEVAHRYGLVYAFSPELREAYLELGMDLPAYNGDRSWTLPVPATFIIGMDGLIHTAFADTDYRVRMEPADIVAALKTLR